MGIWDTIKEKATGSVSFSGFGTGLTILIFVLIISVVIGLILYFVLSARAYKYKIVIFENIAGQGYVPVGRDKAKLIKVGDGGEEILKLRKRKLYRTAYGKKIGTNTYAFAIGPDGYWYNITFGDFDKRLKEIGVEPVDRDMRYMHVAIRRNIKERFETVTFLQKYGGLMAYTALIAVTGIMMWLLFDKFLAISGSVQGAVEAAEQVLEAASDLLGASDNVQSGGSGIRAA